MFENLIEKWRDNPITFADLGLHPDNPLAKGDELIAGEPEDFQVHLNSNLEKRYEILGYLMCVRLFPDFAAQGHPLPEAPRLQDREEGRQDRAGE